MLASIFDLQQTICSFEGVETFDALTVGPITEHPLVRTVFKLPPDQQEVLQVFSALCASILARQPAPAASCVLQLCNDPATFSSYNPDLAVQCHVTCVR